MPTKTKKKSQRPKFLDKITTFCRSVDQKYAQLNKSYNSFIKERHNFFRILPPSIILLVFLIVLLPVFIGRIVSNDTCVFKPLTTDSVALELSSDTELTQNFPKEGLSGQRIDAIAIRIGTYLRTNTSSYKLSLYRDSEIIDEIDVSATDFSDTDYFYFQITPLEIDDSDYYFTFSSSDAEPGNTIAVFQDKGSGDIDYGLFRSSDFQAFVVILSIIFFAVFCTINFLINSGKIKSEQHFLIYMLAFVVPLIFIYPPYEIPDEPFHFKSALRLANYSLDKTPYENLYDPYPTVPITTKCLDYSHISTNNNAVSPNDIADCFTSSEDSSPGQYLAYASKPSTASIISYIPAAIGVKLGDIISDSPMVIFFMGRIFNFIAVYAILLFAIYNAKKHRLLLLATIFVPVFLQQAISYSYDAILNALCLLIISYAIRFIATKTKVRKRDIAILVISVGLVSIIKLPYALLCSAFLFIPRDRFGKSKYAKLLTALLLVASVALIYFAVIAFCNIGFFDTATASGGRGNELSSLFHIKTLAKIVLGTLESNLLFYFRTMIGSFSWLRYYLDDILICAYYVFLVLITLAGSVKISRAARITIAATLAVVAGSFFLVMYLEWTPSGYFVIDGVQGRYFLPLIPLLLFICTPQKAKISLPIDSCYSFMNLITFLFMVFALVSFY